LSDGEGARVKLTLLGSIPATCSVLKRDIMKYYITRGTLFKIEGDDIYQLGEDMDMALPQGDGWSKRNIAWIKIVTDSNPKKYQKKKRKISL